MLGYVDAHHHTTRHGRARQLHVVRARAWIAGEMIMEDDKGCGPADPGLAKHAVRTDCRSIQPADRQDRRPEHQMLRIEWHDAKPLNGAPAERRHGRRYGLLWRRRLQPASPMHWRPATQLHGDDLRGPCRSDSHRSCQFIAIRLVTNPCEPLGAVSRSFATARAPHWQRPLLNTRATSSLSPRARVPCLKSFSCDRSSGDNSFIVLRRGRIAKSAHGRPRRPASVQAKGATLPLEESDAGRLPRTRTLPLPVAVE